MNRCFSLSVSFAISLFLLSVFFDSKKVNAQKAYPPTPSEIKTAPDWAQEMYKLNPNFFTIEKKRREFYATHPFVKTSHTQYFKKWAKQIRKYVNDEGYIVIPTPQQIQDENNTYLAKISKQKNNKMSTSANWQPVGSFDVLDANGSPHGNQTNVYSIARSISSPNVLFCGTEPGELFKSIDAGVHWFSTSENEGWYGVGAIAIDPTNADIVFAGEGNNIHRSLDGGLTWTTTLTASYLTPNEILVHPSDPNIVFACCNTGFYKSIDGGLNWSQIDNTESYDIKLNTANPSIIYLLKKNNSLNICEFYMSNDMGATWNNITSGWYNSTDPDRICNGGRIGTSPADPNRVYAYLIGASKANDNGHIGLYRSDDGGYTWTLPNGPAGGPYSAAHPNTTTFDNGVLESYNQGFYNCALMVNSSNADDVLIGGLNTWRSADGGYTFTGVCGYIGGPISMHVDNQDFRAYGSDYYITTDGGIYHSTDFFYTQPELKMSGVRGEDYWGFGHAWNEDIYIGGLYHNGNLAHHPHFGTNATLAIGGAEAATGYSNPGVDTMLYTSDVGGVLIPSSLPNAVQYFGIGMNPNESYFSSESSEIQFHPNNYNTCFIGNSNKIWKSNDGTGSFHEVYAFPIADFSVTDIEIPYDNPDFMYVAARRVSGGVGKIAKSTDGGQTWTLVTTPTSNNIMNLAVDLSDHNTLYVGYMYSGTTQKVFKTTDGCTTWIDITGSMLASENVQELVVVPHTNGGVYCFTNKSVYYRDNSMTDWILYQDGLPAFVSCTGAKPFYRDNQLKMGTYGKGVWEGDFYAHPSLPIANITVDKDTFLYNCYLDSFYFASTSVIDGSGTRSWSFPGGSPSISTSLHPHVYYATPGAYQAILTVTNTAGAISRDTLEVVVKDFQAPEVVSEGFEAGMIPYGWERWDEPGSPNSWSITNTASGFGTSTSCMIYDNFNYDSGGKASDMRFYLNTDTMLQAQLYLDVAYAQYDNTYSDTLEILVSTDCGATFTSLYRKGGDDLATAPDQNTMFTPSATQWRRDSVDLSTVIHEEKVIIAIRNTGRYGNAIYVDNINLQSERDTTIVDIPTATTSDYYFTPTPNILTASQPLAFHTNIKDPFQFKIFDLNGKMVYNNPQVSPSTALTLPQLANGTYIYAMQASHYMQRGKLIIADKRSR